MKVGALLSRFRKANGDGLFSTLNFSALPTFPGLQSAAFLPMHRTMHRTLDRLSCCFPIARHDSLLLKKVSGWLTARLTRLGHPFAVGLLLDSVKAAFPRLESGAAASLRF